MARFNNVGLEAFMEVLEKESERVDRNGEDAVRAGAEVAITAMRSTVPYDTHKLEESIGMTMIKKDPIDGLHCYVYPQGDRPGNHKSYGRFADLGFLLEYGTINKRIKPFSWMQKAVETNTEAIGEAMADVLFRD